MADKYVNFYENIAEAHIRLRNTVVMYDGAPYHIWAITSHKPDGIFRVYMSPIGEDPNRYIERPDFDMYHPTSPELGPYLDKWMDQTKDHKFVRKHMNSPHFGKFRPFPLGMCNRPDGGVSYFERQPQRNREQGLTNSMVDETFLDINPGTNKFRSGRMSVGLRSAAFESCVLGTHPGPNEVLSNLLDSDVSNTGVAFNRNFALLRGPIGMLFLAYKRDVIGVLPQSNFTQLTLGREYKHLKEVVQELNLFSTIN